MGTKENEFVMGGVAPAPYNLDTLEIYRFYDDLPYLKKKKILAEKHFCRGELDHRVSKL